MKKANTLIDISVPLDSALPTWPGSVSMKVEKLSCFENGNNVNVTKLTCDVHTGTHIETSLHFIPGGSSVTQIPLDTLIGDAYVAYLPMLDVITPSDMEEINIPEGVDKLLLRTKNSELWNDGKGVFMDDYSALSPEAAQWVVERNIKLLGVDYLSVDLYKESTFKNHLTLLKGGVVILEGLNLSSVMPGIYELMCLPIKLVGAEGAPARAVLRSNGSIN